MVIHFMKEDCLAALKVNVKGNLKQYENLTNEWIYEFFEGDTPFAEYKVPVESIQLDTGQSGEKEKGRQDVGNAIRLYSAMKNLSDTQAADERLWAGLCHGDFWTYMNKRWEGFKPSRDPVSSILWRYFFNGKSSVRRALFRNTLSRLWWLGRLTYDSERKDPFELTRYWEEDFATKSLILFSSNYMGNPKLTQGLISALMELDKQGFAYGSGKREVYYTASQYLNVFGGTHILDYFTADEIRERVLYYMRGLAGGKVPNNT